MKNEWKNSSDFNWNKRLIDIHKTALVGTDRQYYLYTVVMVMTHTMFLTIEIWDFWVFWQIPEVH